MNAFIECLDQKPCVAIAMRLRGLSCEGASLGNPSPTGNVTGKLNTDRATCTRLTSQQSGQNVSGTGQHKHLPLPDPAPTIVEESSVADDETIRN